MNWMRPEPEPHPFVDLQTDRPHSARIYDYILGGKDNFEADRQAAAAMLAKLPAVAAGMRSNRSFMVRMTRHLVSEYGMQQFLDVGTGLPTSPNLHEAAQSIAPDTRVVYVDNDPIVLAHARALLAGTPEGRTAYVDADLLDPEGILASPQVREALDLTKPVALTLIAVLQHITDEDVARDLVRRLFDPLPTGSMLAITSVPKLVENADANQEYRNSGLPMKERTREQFAALFGDAELIEPGITDTNHWRPEELKEGPCMWAGVAVKR
jgi:hypothetical protein